MIKSDAARAFLRGLQREDSLPSRIRKDFAKQFGEDFNALDEYAFEVYVRRMNSGPTVMASYLKPTPEALSEVFPMDPTIQSKWDIMADDGWKWFWSITELKKITARTLVRNKKLLLEATEQKYAGG
jgi:hypothetical protein